MRLVRDHRPRPHTRGRRGSDRALYRDYEWWDDREVERVRKSLEDTDVAVGVEDGGDLVAASRTLTDYTYYAVVFDVIVAADRRGEGVGRALMDGVRGHPDLQSVPGLSLLCRRGLVPFYESVGFELSDREVDVPEGGTEELVRMKYVRDESSGSASGSQQIE